VAAEATAEGSREPACAHIQAPPAGEQRWRRSRRRSRQRPAGVSAQRARRGLRPRRFAIEQRAGIEAAAAGRFEQASGQLSAALAEWRGPVLEDLRDFPFVDTFAAALAEDKLVAITVRAEAEIACGRTHSIIGELEALVAEHPYREPLWAQLITAYYLAERQYDALDTYGRLKTLLADGLGIDPGPTLRGLHQRILRQEPLDVKNAARATAKRAAATLQRHTKVARSPPSHSFATLPEVVIRCEEQPPGSGASPTMTSSSTMTLLAATTRYRQHRNSFVITDLQSANGVDVADQRIRNQRDAGRW